MIEKDASVALGINHNHTVHEAFHHAKRHEAVSPNIRYLRVLKFGGTSVGNPACVEKVVEIVQSASQDSAVVVVVSALSGVTDSLFEAAAAANACDRNRVDVLLQKLCDRHNSIADALIRSNAMLKFMRGRIDELIGQAYDICERTIPQKGLTERIRDSVLSIGERLSAPLIACVLRERGIVSESVEATEIIVTNSAHGRAEPQMSATRERCDTRLRPLTHCGTVPVVTGYIGATSGGVVTTLGRGGSDYSATVIAAALNADEVVIWTDVDGLLTADPRLVPQPCTIHEISYREAAELALFGAKVLHPNTLKPLMHSGIRVWIRNTFGPELPGTKITTVPSPNRAGVKAVSAVADAALLSFSGSETFLDQLIETGAAVRAAPVSPLHWSPRHHVCLLAPFASAKQTLESLLADAPQNRHSHTLACITNIQNVGVIALVGENLRGIPNLFLRIFDILRRNKIEVLAIIQPPSTARIALLVHQSDVKAAMIAIHEEFELGSLLEKSICESSGQWKRELLESPAEP